MAEPAESTHTESATTDDQVAEDLAQQAAGNSNGNGNGHAAADTNDSTDDASRARGTFDMWDDLANETEQDKRKRENPNSQQDQEQDIPGDPRNDVTDDDLRSETTTLKEANATVSLYLAMLDMGISFVCCGIRDDFSLRTQLKYRIHPWRKKAIQIPWVRLQMLPGRKRRPGWALVGAITAGTVPTLVLAYMDNWHEQKRKEDPEYQKRTNETPPAGGSGRAHWKVYTDPRAQENPGYSKAEAAEYAEYEEVTDDTTDDDSDQQQNGTQKKSKPGRHARTCPKHLDSANGICNCK